MEKVERFVSWKKILQVTNLSKENHWLVPQAAAFSVY